MTNRAMLGVQGRATGWVRRDGRCLADLIGHCQFCRQLPRLTRNLRAVLFAAHGIFQLRNTLLQTRALGALRQSEHKAL